METEKIDVPKFDGYKCVGLRVPDYVHGSVLILTKSGSGLYECTGGAEGERAQLCYRKIKPKRITFEFTGEVRLPKRGEWFKSSSGGYSQADADYEISEREILRIVEEQS